MIILITIVLFYFYKRKHLSLDGFLSSTLMAGLILGFGGLKYVLPIAIFFILSTLLSKIGPKICINQKVVEMQIKYLQMVA